MDILDNEFFTEEAEVPAFYRLNSEVKEKPSTLEDGHLDYQVNSSTPSPGSSSHASFHSNAVNVADSWWLPSSLEFPVSHGDELLALSLCVAGGVSDSELEAQGDVDEGFDEEFEDRDLTEADSNNRQVQTYPMEDLDPKEVQQLLGGDQFLDEFDLGVDVLDREAQPILAQPVVSSPMTAGACTPGSVSSPSPSSPGVDLHSQVLQRNRWNLNVSSPMAASPIAASPVASSPGSASDVGLADSRGNVVVGTQDYSQDQLAMLVSACMTDRTPTTYGSTPLVDHAPLMDLSETIALASANPLMTSEPTSTDLQSVQQFIQGHLPSLLPSSNSDFSTTTSQVLMDSNSIFSNLNFSTLNNDSTSYTSPEYRHPPPPSPPISTSHTSAPPSPSSSVDQDSFSLEERKIIDMPWYQFRKVLDDSSVPDARKEEMKNIRRKGKNKAAAKVCRQKKLRNIRGLEHEIQELKKTKQNMTFRSRSLEREIAQLKKKYQQSR